MSGSDLTAALTPVVEALERLRVRYYVTGSVASSAHGVARARAQAIDQTAGAARVIVASAEDTVLAKLEWFRRGGETSERQWWDIVGVLRVNPNADAGYLHRWAAELGVADLLERALTQVAE